MMFHRVIRCLITAKKPLNFKSNRQILRSRNSQCMDSNLLTLNKCFSSRVDKSPKIATSLNETETDSTEERKEEEEEEEEEKEEEEESKNSKNDNELEALIKSDPTMDKRYKILQLEVEVMRGDGKLVPDEIKPIQWVELLKGETRSARTKYLTFLFKTEKKRQHTKQKKLEARIEREKSREETPLDLDKNTYGLHKNSMFLRIYDTTMNRFYNSRLMQAMMFGQKLVIDCSYYSKMTTREITECAKQLNYLFAQNRVHRDPFDLHFCNANKSSLLMQKFKVLVPSAYDNDFPLNINEESYLEKFDKDKLVYLTPHTHVEMNEYDPESIYIIGGIVDKTNNEPLTLAKAKKEGLKMAKLPLDKYLMWGAGSGKRLPLNHMVNILNDIKYTGDWKKALEHVAKRKLEKNFDNREQKYTQGKRSLIDMPYQKRKPYYKTQSFTFESRKNRSRFSNE